MLKLKKVNYKITNNTSFSDLYLNVSLERLIKLLGQPSYVGSGDNKTQLEWVFYESSDKCFTIYDYKSVNLIHEIKRWHVGCKGMKKDELQIELTNLGFNSVDEIEDAYPNR